NLSRPVKEQPQTSAKSFLDVVLPRDLRLPLARKFVRGRICGLPGVYVDDLIERGGLAVILVSDAYGLAVAAVGDEERARARRPRPLRHSDGLQRMSEQAVNGAHVGRAIGWFPKRPVEHGFIVVVATRHKSKSTNARPAQYPPSQDQQTSTRSPLRKTSRGPGASLQSAKGKDPKP